MKKTSTKQDISKKIASYSSMAAVFALSSTQLGAQVVYTDVDPDVSVGPSDAYDLDMNNDGDVDFTLNQTSFTIPSFFYTNPDHLIFYDGLINLVHVYPVSGNAVNAYTVATASGGAIAYGFALNVGANIGASTSFLSYSNQLLGAFLSILDYPGVGSNYYYNAVGPWAAKTHKFLGLRFDAGGNTYYGWVRLTMDNAELTVEDYAYMSAPDAMIEAGEMPNAVQNLLSDNQLNAYSYGNSINVVTKDLKTTGGDVKIFNLSGQVVYQNTLDLSGMNIVLDKVATGEYTLQVTTHENGVYSKKLFIQN